MLLGPRKHRKRDPFGGGRWLGARLQGEEAREMGVRGLTASTLPLSKPLHSGHRPQLRTEETKAGRAPSDESIVKPSPCACFPPSLPPSGPGWMGCRKQQTGPFRNCSFQSAWQDLIQNLSHPGNTRGDALCGSREPAFQGLLNGSVLPPACVSFKATCRTER